MVNNKKVKGSGKQGVKKGIGPSKKVEPILDPRLTVTEAEVMFIIWKSSRPITNAEIAEEHLNYFRPAERKDENTIRGIINRIRNRGIAFTRDYISSHSRPQRHQIADDPQEHTKPTVHSQATAVMLLELKAGYINYENPAREILREPFERYIKEKYCHEEVNVNDRLFKDASDVTNRLALAEASGYVKFVKYGKAMGIKAAPRLDDDLEYLILIVEYYLAKIKQHTPAADLVADLENLLSLFGRAPLTH